MFYQHAGKCLSAQVNPMVIYYINMMLSGPSPPRRLKILIGENYKSEVLALICPLPEHKVSGNVHPIIFVWRPGEPSDFDANLRHVNPEFLALFESRGCKEAMMAQAENEGAELEEPLELPLAQVLDWNGDVFSGEEFCEAIRKLHGVQSGVQVDWELGVALQLRALMKGERIERILNPIG